MAGLPTEAEPGWHGPAPAYERAPDRWLYEEEVKKGHGSPPSRVVEGILARVTAILYGTRDDRVFSPSAAPVLADNFADIALRGGAITVHENQDDEFGQALVRRDADGNFSVQLVTAPNQIIRVTRLPLGLVSVPQTPGDPDEVKQKARKGELKFEYLPTKNMAVMGFQNGEWSEASYPPVGSTELGTTADRYGQTIFGGMRALRLRDGRVALFRPDRHAERFARNAERLMMPSIPPGRLVEIYKQLVRANAKYLPDFGTGSMYLAPGLRPNKNQVGVHPNVQYLLTCEAMPVSKIFARPIKLRVETRFHRAAPGGVGDVKASGNYSPSFEAKMAAIEAGFDDIICLDAENSETRELSSSNIFFVDKNNILHTPNLSGEILDGVTRDSILEIAKELQAKGLIRGVREGPVYRSDYPKMKEAFSSGTGVTMQGVKLIQDGENTYNFDISQGGMGPVTKALHDRFSQILAGDAMNDPRYKDWLVVVD